MKSSTTKHLSKRQIKSFQANEERRKKRKLQEKLDNEHQQHQQHHRASSSSSSSAAAGGAKTQITDQMVQDAILKARIDRIQSMLPSRSYVKPTTIKDVIQRKMAQTPKKISALPYQAQRQHVNWLTLAEQGMTSSLSLTEEIERFALYVSLEEDELIARDLLIEELRTVVQCKWPHADLRAFGSYAAGLSTFLSDIDLSIVFKGGQEELETVLRQQVVPGKPTATSVATTSSNAGSSSTSNSSSSNTAVVVDTSGSTASLPPLTNPKSIPMSTQDSSTSTFMKGNKVTFSDDHIDDIPVKSPLELDTTEPEEKKSRKFKEQEEEDEDDVEVTWEIDTGSKESPAVGKKRKLVIDDVYDDEGSQDGSSVDDPIILDNDNEEEDVTGRDVIDLIDDDDEEDDEELIELSDSSEDNDEEVEDDEDEEYIDDENEDQEDEEDSDDLNDEDDEDYVDEDEDEDDDMPRKKVRRNSNSAPKEFQLEEDLDIQLIDDNQLVSTNGRTRSLEASEMDFTNTFSKELGDDDNEDILAITTEGSNGNGRGVEERGQQLTMLRSLFTMLKPMPFIEAMEFRHRARVPIINIQHRSGIECDISVGLAAKDTSAVIQALQKDSEDSGIALFALSAVLKVYLYQLGLDQPFNGGLGSFKLYIMIVKHLRANPQFFKNKGFPNLGLLFLSFLSYYGSDKNWNEFTVIDLTFPPTALSDGIGSTQVTFEQTKLLPYIQEAFRSAYFILDKQCRKRYTDCKNRAAAALAAKQSSNHSNHTKEGASGLDNVKTLQNYEDFSDNNSFEDESDGLLKEILDDPFSDNNKFSHLNVLNKSRLSSSLLGSILHCELLQKERDIHRRKCAISNAHSSKEAAKENLALILQEYTSPIHGLVSFEELEGRNPLLALRLGGYRRDDLARHLAHAQQSGANNNGEFGSGNGNTNNSSKPYYKMSLNGVIGRSIQQSTPKPSPSIDGGGKASKRYSRGSSGKRYEEGMGGGKDFEEQLAQYYNIHIDDEVSTPSAKVSTINGNRVHVILPPGSGNDSGKKKKENKKRKLNTIPATTTPNSKKEKKKRKKENRLLQQNLAPTDRGKKRKLNKSKKESNPPQKKTNTNANSNTAVSNKKQKNSFSYMPSSSSSSSNSNVGRSKEHAIDLTSAGNNNKITIKNEKKQKKFMNKLKRNPEAKQQFQIKTEKK